MGTASPTSPPGRPRDPAVGERVTQAAVELFGEVGWAGFTIDAVARRAGVGKASIYLRWTTKEALLSAALLSRAVSIADIDTGTVRGDLLQLARQILGVYLSASGPAMMRVAIDGGLIPEIRARHDAMNRSQTLAARAIVRRGIERGELPRGTSVTILLDTVCGGAMIHALGAPAELRERVAGEADRYAERLVDFLLGSARPAGEGPPAADGGPADNARSRARR